MPGSRKPDAFDDAATLVESLRRHVAGHGLPVCEHVAVLRLQRRDGGYRLLTSEGAVDARHVVVASGAQRVPRAPAAAQALPEHVCSLHAADYRAPDRLPDGAVLVVGSGQTGCQVAEDLLDAGRRVLLATSRVGRVPRRYRGRDIITWWRDTGFLDVRGDEVDEAMRRTRQPQVSGVRGGHTISLQQLARGGAELVGGIEAVRDGRLLLRDDVAQHVAFADEIAARHRSAVDAYVDRHDLCVPAAEPDPAEAPEPGLGSDAPRELQLGRRGVRAVVWCTGFGPDSAWLPDGMLDARGAPPDVAAAAAEGLHVIGVPWTPRRGSGVLLGLSRDAHAIARAISAGPRRAPAAVARIRISVL
jgi:putative flavoprotein involved in K+ transport